MEEQEQTTALAATTSAPAPVANWAIPQTLKAAQELAELLAVSGMVPKAYVRKPQDIVVAMMMGHTVGLAPMQALQNIAVINGTPSIWGDAMPAICMTHPLWKDIEETFDYDNLVATCKVWRKGHAKPCVHRFGKEQAIAAGLWAKGTYKQYPVRMLQIRARAFALRDAFADALKGLQCAEEIEDLALLQAEARVVQSERGVEGLKGRLGITVEEEVDPVEAPDDEPQEAPAEVDDPAADETPADVEEARQEVLRLLEILKGPEGVEDGIQAIELNLGQNFYALGYEALDGIVGSLAKRIEKEHGGQDDGEA